MPSLSPQIGERHQAEISRLAQETGYRLSVHPHPNQHSILQIANRALREQGWQISKGPGIHTDRAELNIKLVNEVPAQKLDELRERLLQETGFTLVVET